MKRTTIVLVAGGLLCVMLGLVIGLRHISTNITPGGAGVAWADAGALPCGSALVPSSHTVSTFTFVAPSGSRPLPHHFTIRSCSDARRSSLVLTIVLWTAGVLLVGAAWAPSLRRHNQALQSS
jgi:hypothetical protein